jgi:hypothetical protein
MEKYLDDLDDADLTHVAVEGMNPIAWQVGHLIATDCNLLGKIRPDAVPALPAGFAEAHPRDPATSNGAYLTKAEYLRLFKSIHDAVRGVLESISDADLDADSPEALRKNFPKVGHLLNLTGQHAVLHLGQFVAVRRSLKKPIVF